MYLQRTLPYNLDLETILIEKAYICSFKNKVGRSRYRGGKAKHIHQHKASLNI